MLKKLTIEGGSSGALDQLIDDLTAHLGSGWSRDPREEGRVNKTADVDPAYAFRAPSGAVLFLSREGSKFVVDNVVPPEIGSLTEAHTTTLLDDFAERCVRPVAARLGLTVTLSPDPLPTHWLRSGKAAKLLRAFARRDTALSGHVLDEQRWFAFLIQAHRDGADPEPSNLQRWLIEQAKFPEGHAREFADQYAFARRLLTAYEKTVGI